MTQLYYIIYFHCDITPNGSKKKSLYLYVIFIFHSPTDYNIVYYYIIHPTEQGDFLASKRVHLS